MPNVLVKKEALPIEVGSTVCWVNLETRKISKVGGSPAVIQYWAFLPPGMHPATIRGKDRETVIADVRQAIASQVS